MLVEKLGKRGNPCNQGNAFNSMFEGDSDTWEEKLLTGSKAKNRTGGKKKKRRKTKRGKKDQRVRENDRGTGGFLVGQSSTKNLPKTVAKKGAGRWDHRMKQPSRATLLTEEEEHLPI